MDADLEALSREQLISEVEKLRTAIREHRDASGQDLCWHHPALWSLLPEKVIPVIEVPDWPQFIAGCVRYRQSLDQQLPDAPRTKPSTRTSIPESTVKLGYTILYVPDVENSLRFFERAFGLSKRFLHESGTYGELDTGETTLSFAAHELGDGNFPGGHVHASASDQPLGMEIALVTAEVAAAHARALAAGATELAPPSSKPWGQVVSYVRSPDGCLIELCTPVGT